MKNTIVFLLLIIGSSLASDEMLIYRRQHLQLVAQVESLIQQAHSALSIYQGKPEEQIVQQELQAIETLFNEIKTHQRNSVAEREQVAAHERVIIDLLAKQIMGTGRPHDN